jgi:serine/threonine-protein kinase
MVSISTDIIARVDKLLDRLDGMSVSCQDAILKEIEITDSEAARLARKLLSTRAEDLISDTGAVLNSEIGSQCFANEENVELFKQGDRLSNYQIHSLIGRGGSADVYEASRTFDGFSQPVALKVNRSLHADAETPIGAAERKALARLDHPNIARFVDAGNVEGRTFLVMELVKGEPITSYADRIGADIRRRLSWVVDLCDALVHAHGRLIAHCDIKPSNTLIEKNGRLRLLDFGIANILNEVGETSRPALAFTPQYAAPEQILGAPPGVATDIFQVGALMFRLITGQVWLAQPKRVVEGDYSEILSSHRRSLREAIDGYAKRSKITKRTGSSAQLSRQGIDERLEAIVRRCLNRNPAQRYASASDLRADLRAWLEYRPVSALVMGPIGRVSLWLRRHHKLVAATTGAALCVSSIVAYQNLRVSEARQLSEQERMRARSSERFMARLFQQASPYATQAEDSLGTFVKVGDAMLASDRQLDPRTRAVLESSLARLELQNGDSAAAAKRASRTLAGMQQGAIDESPVRIELTQVLASSKAASDDLASAVSLLEELMAEEKARALPEDAIGNVRATLAELYRRLGKLNEAKREYSAVREWLFSSAHLESIERITALQGYVLLLDQLGDQRTELLQTADVLRNQGRSSSSPVVEAQRLMALGYTELLLGRFEESAAYAERSANLHEVLLGANHPQTIRAHGYACTSYRDAAIFDAARTHCFKALQSDRARKAPSSDNIRVFLMNLAGIEFSSGNYERAREYLTQAWPLVKNTREPFQELFYYSLMGRVQYELGDLVSASTSFAAAEDIRWKHFASSEEIKRHVHSAMIPTLLATGNLDRARQYAGWTGFSPPHRKAADLEQTLLDAHILLAQGYMAQAERFASRAAVEMELTSSETSALLAANALRLANAFAENDRSAIALKLARASLLQARRASIPSIEKKALDLSMRLKPRPLGQSEEAG